jgi:hypothetical protein
VQVDELARHAAELHDIAQVYRRVDGQGIEILGISSSTRAPTCAIGWSPRRGG